MGPPPLAGGRPEIGAIAGPVRERFGRGVAIHRIMAGSGTRDEPLWDEPLLMDGSLEFHRRYGRPSPGLVVLRPDGYIGFLGTAEASSELMTYLSIILGE